MTKKQKPKQSAKERLIIAGIKVIENNGIQGFSLRKAAETCGISCAAPYKHFKNKDEFLTKIIQYINDKWLSEQAEVIVKYEGNIKEQLINISLAYIDFLVKNPQFRSIIMIKDESMSAENNEIRHKISAKSAELVETYCKINQIPSIIQKERLFMVRSLMYGAALMFDNGEMPYNQENILMIRQIVDSAFDF
ncbi:MAG: TetR/AcrR family transcriptional regulator [Erysipelotrichaceae bacterium]|nr:TetR/AcrR family transcriptional regulator [Erysipelotrichaceae bacterium]